MNDKRLCLHCKKFFDCYKSSKRKFCCKKCSESYNREHPELNPFYGEKGKELYKKSMLKKYGVEHNSQIKSVKEKKKETIKEYGFGSNSYKQGMFKNHGCLHNKQIGKSLEEINTMHDKDKLISIIKETPNISITQLAQKLNYSEIRTIKILTQFDIYNLIKNKRGRSKGEIELDNFIKSLGVKTKHINANQKGTYEIDIFCLEYNIGFEFNGDYWHKAKIYDDSYCKEKFDYFKQKNIHIFNILEHEWLDNKEEVQIAIKRVLKIMTEDYFVIGEIDIKYIDENTKKIQIINGEFILEELIIFKPLQGLWNICYNVYNDNYYYTINGLERMLKYLINNCNPERIEIEIRNNEFCNFCELLHKLKETPINYKGTGQGFNKYNNMTCLPIDVFPRWYDSGGYLYQYKRPNIFWSPYCRNVPIVATDKYRGDVGNGYAKTGFDFKVVEI